MTPKDKERLIELAKGYLYHQSLKPLSNMSIDDLPELMADFAISQEVKGMADMEIREYVGEITEYSKANPVRYNNLLILLKDFQNNILTRKP